MAQRIFRDVTGEEWRAFDVRPDSGDRRRGPDRRVSPASDPVIERRRTQERRVSASGAYDTGARHAYRPGFERGWLCFEHGLVRRRLAPIPARWETCSERELVQYLQQAIQATATPRIA